MRRPAAPLALGLAIVLLLVAGATTLVVFRGQRPSATLMDRLPRWTDPRNVGRGDLAPSAPPSLAFVDARGEPRTLNDFRGRAVLLNIWATWCAPCRKEMPALDRLQARLGGPAFEVVALSIDRGGVVAVRSFYDEMDVRSLAVYVDAQAQALTRLGAVGIPLTVLVDRNGRELWRVIGPAQWDQPASVDRILASVPEVAAR